MTILTMTYLLLQSASYLSLWPYLLLAVVLFVLIAVLIQNRVVRRRVNDSIASATSTYEMMEKALKIVDNDVVIYDIPGKVIRRLRGNLLPTPEMRAEEFAPHIHPDDVEQVLSTVRQMAQGKTQQVEYSYRWRVSEAGEEPRYFYIRNNSVAEYAPGSSTPTSIISVLVDETEQRERTAFGIVQMVMRCQDRSALSGPGETFQQADRISKPGHRVFITDNRNFYDLRGYIKRRYRQHHLQRFVFQILRHGGKDLRMHRRKPGPGKDWHINKPKIRTGFRFHIFFNIRKIEYRSVEIKCCFRDIVFFGCKLKIC